MARRAHGPIVPLFTYRSPQRRWGLTLALLGAFLIAAAVGLSILQVVNAALGSGGAGAILGALCGPLLIAAVGAALVIAGGTGLWMSWFGPTSMDDYEGPGDDVIWGRCPRCGWHNVRSATACAQCGRSLPPRRTSF